MKKVLGFTSLLLLVVIFSLCLTSIELLAKVAKVTKLTPRQVSLQCDKRLPLLAVKYAETQVGIKEKTGHNDGECEKYLNSVGLRKGDPYCQSGVYWCWLQSVKELGLPYSFIPFTRTGSTQTAFNDALRIGKIYSNLIVKSGDLLYWKYNGKWSGHVEMIRKPVSSVVVLTVGFNTSSGVSGSQSNGGGVYRRTRSLKDPLGRMSVLGLMTFNRVN